MNIVNLTPHTITLYNEDGVAKNFESSGVARCNEESILDGYIGSVPVFKKVYGEVYGLPEPAYDTIYIVSYIVLRALNNERPDVYGVTETVRNEAGQIIGFRALSSL